MKEYIHLKILCTWRLFRDLPLIVQLLFAAAFVLLIWFLVSDRIEFSWRSFFILVGAQCLLSILFLNIKEKEKILLLTLQIPLRQVNLLRVALVAVFFLLLNPLSAAAGTVLSLLVAFGWKTDKQSWFAQMVLPAIFVKTSYRWLAAYRKGGFLIIPVGLFLQAMAIIHHNDVLGYFSVLFMISISCCLASLFMEEAGSFLLCYPGADGLLKNKFRENLVNSAILSIFTLPFAVWCMYHGNYNAFAFILLGIYINSLIEAIFYTGYPSILLSFILLFVVATIIFALVFELTIYLVVPISLVLLCVLWFTAYLNIQSTLYERHSG